MVHAASDVLLAAVLAVGGGDGGTAGEDRKPRQHPHPAGGHQQVPNHRPHSAAACIHDRPGGASLHRTVCGQYC